MKKQTNINFKVFKPLTPSLRQQIQINYNLFLGKQKPLKFLKKGLANILAFLNSSELIISFAFCIDGNFMTLMRSAESPSFNEIIDPPPLTKNTPSYFAITFVISGA